MQKITAGIYDCTLGNGTLHEEPSGAVMFYVMVAIADLPEHRYGFCFVNKKGEMRQRAIDDLHTILGTELWPDKRDWTPLENLFCNNIPAKAVVVDEQWTDREGNVRDGSTISFVNPVNGGGKHGLPPATGNAKSLATKYGSQLRALYGSTAKTAAPSAPAKPATPPAKSAPPPSKPKAPPSAPKASAQSAVQMANEAWVAVNAAMSEADETAVTDKWFELMEAHAGTKDQTAVTCEQWQAVRNAIAEMAGDPLPF